MTGGFRETASLMAIAALLCVGATVFGAKPAKAADLGGDCCADLEERVADLEATTVRKGNKKVSVQIYGKVNYAALWWDDGGEQNFYTVNNYNKSTRTGIKGKAKIAGDWEGGFRLEWEYRPAASQFLNQFNDNNQESVSRSHNIVVRWSQMYLANKHYGTLNWGLTTTPKYDITKNALEYISTIKGEGGGLSDTLVSDFRMNPSFRLRPTASTMPRGYRASPGRTSPAATAHRTSTTARRAATALPILRQSSKGCLKGSTPNGAISRTTIGARLCATRIRCSLGRWRWRFWGRCMAVHRQRRL